MITQVSAVIAWESQVVNVNVCGSHAYHQLNDSILSVGLAFVVVVTNLKAG